MIEPAEAGISPAIERSSVDLPDPVRPSSPTIWPSIEFQLDAVEHQMLAAIGARESLAQRMNVEKRVAHRSTFLEHVPEKWLPVFRKGHATI